MSKRRLFCPLCTALGLLGLGLLAWTLIGRGDGKVDQVRQRAEADAAQILGAAGFSWTHLKIDNEVGRLEGEAPNLAARAAAYTTASTVLMPMMGVPGVFARLEDAQTSPAIEMPMVAASAAPAVPASGALTTQDCEAAMSRVVEQRQIRFKVASAEIDPSSQPILKQLHQLSERCPQARVRVEGHTDANGDAATNMRLSERRAQAVVQALVKEGVPAARLQAKGFGEERLLDSGNTPQAHERNRRIEFHLAQHKAP